MELGELSGTREQYSDVKVGRQCAWSFTDLAQRTCKQCPISTVALQAREVNEEEGEEVQVGLIAVHCARGSHYP